MVKRGSFRKKPSEDIIRKNMIWMPYHKIQYDYTSSKKGSIQKSGETALNAMFCESVKNERELFTLFRPNYLAHKKIEHCPQSEEIIGQTVSTDFDRILGNILKKFNEVEDELNELRSELQKTRSRIRRYGHIMPMLGTLKKERELSEKVARLTALRDVSSMCLNVNEDIRSIEVVDHDVFYYPNLVVTVKHKENGTERYILVNLVESGLINKRVSCDRELTELCNKNSECREIIDRSLTSHVLRV